ncbi:hypothetical protein [Acinetobacter bouvetii]|uniref:Uncharacterized protein n=1 Tax=Acinetobacter bouvetii TaxID=202951 RepID=A0A811GBR7_9GAMM|nr:hypothetical protein [Acinetobacter bouvetii]CAB1213722.1 hypothetical protein SFB21_1358 [Acinetobacter bouvetii]
MAIKSISLLPKLSSVLSTSTLNSSLVTTPTLSSLINNDKITGALTGLLANLTSSTQSSSVNLSALTSSLPKIITVIQGLSSNGSSSAINADTISTLMKTLQPLLTSLNGQGSAIDTTQLMQSLPVVVKSIQSLMASVNSSGSVPDSLSSVMTNLKPLLDTLASSNSSSDISKVVSTLSQVLEIAAPLIKVAGSLGTGEADYGQVSHDLTANLMPLLAAVNKDGSTVDMAQLSQALPAVVGSVTTLIATFTKANEGNIPETISGAIQGINPLFKLLANSGAIDANQTETVNAVYDVLNSVKVIIDTVNNPDLSNISGSLNNVIDALKPVIAMIDTNGQLDGLLGNTELPDLNGLLGQLGGDINLDGIKDGLGQLLGNTPMPISNLSELFQANGNTGDIDLTSIIPGLTGSLQQTAGSSLTSYDVSTSATSTPSLELDQPVVFG